MALILEDSKVLPNQSFQTPLDLSHYVVSPEGGFEVSKQQQNRMRPESEEDEGASRPPWVWPLMEFICFPV